MQGELGGSIPCEVIKIFFTCDGKPGNTLIEQSYVSLYWSSYMCSSKGGEAVEDDNCQHVETFFVKIP